jgi:NADH-quinone oxidoreductase subunit M
MIGIGGYALIRILVSLLPESYATITLGIGLWGLITMIYGGLMAFAQDDIKRLLAYSSVSQMGYIIFGIATAATLGVSGAVFHYVTHGTGKAILFMMAGTVIMQAHGLRSISKMGGLGGKLPLTATAALIGFLAIMGIPPTNGFQSEWMIFSGALTNATQTGTPIRYALAVVALASTALTGGYALWTIKRVFFGSLPAELRDVKEAAPTVTIPLLVLAFITILLGVQPRYVDDLLIPTISRILTGG